jgi:twitching motility protein PilI
MSQTNASFKKLLEYEQRALSFEPGQGQGKARRGEWAGVIFGIGETRLTCNIERVHEFLPPPPVTRVPGTKPWILGLANVRGDLVTIVDLSFYLVGERSNITMRSRLLAASLRGRPVGLLVDEVFGQRSFSADEAKDAKVPEGSPLHAYISKQFHDDREVWQVLDIDALFGTPEFLNGSAA